MGNKEERSLQDHPDSPLPSLLRDQTPAATLTHPGNLPAEMAQGPACSQAVSSSISLSSWLESFPSCLKLLYCKLRSLFLDLLTERSDYSFPVCQHLWCNTTEGTNTFSLSLHSARLSISSSLAELLHTLLFSCSCCSLPKFLPPAFPLSPRRGLPQTRQNTTAEIFCVPATEGGFLQVSSTQLSSSYTPVRCLFAAVHYWLTPSFCITVTPPPPDLFPESSHFLFPILHTHSWFFFLVPKSGRCHRIASSFLPDNFCSLSWLLGSAC